MVDEFFHNNAFAYDDNTPCANLFTDGSFKHGRAGWGFYLDDDQGRQVRLCGGVQGKKTNNTAELTAIIRGVEYCQQLVHRPLHIYTDSVYCILSLSNYRRNSARFIEESQHIPLAMQNVELISKACQVIANHSSTVYISKVKAQTGGND